MTNSTREPSQAGESSKRALLDMAMGYFRGKVLCAAVRLGIADALADGPKTVDELAAKTQANPVGLRRFLRALASIGVVEEIEPARFALTPFGDPLRRNAPGSVWASMIFWCDLLSGDLFEAVPAGADVYLMRCVLHGYDDESAVRILRNVRAAMAPESRLLLIEVVLPNRIARADPELEKLLMSDLNMLAVTGGRERSEDEWNALLASARLERCRILAVAGQAAGILEAARAS